VVEKKQKELDTLSKTKQDHEARIMRLKERIKERKIKNFWSDESEESEDEPALDFFTR
jgi:cell division protein FtsB